MRKRRRNGRGMIRSEVDEGGGRRKRRRRLGHTSSRSTAIEKTRERMKRRRRMEEEEGEVGEVEGWGPGEDEKRGVGEGR